MSHLNKDGPCCRCLSEEHIQYDNTLGDSMCKQCWKFFFLYHESCSYCNESVLMPEFEEAWLHPDFQKVRCMSSDLGHRNYGDEGVLCKSCFKWAKKLERRKAKKCKLAENQ
jgi:hypothetical protein